MYFNPQEHYLQEVFLKSSFIEEMKIKAQEYQKILQQYQTLMKAEKKIKDDKHKTKYK
ncbi:hypothetical protein ['Prunus avium' virescence phytoplasma]|uniref:hypothetical protein n=1 Tax='Prunus avium' virescence phytoplasma TaxID=2056121 RepID=UPI003D8032D0